jgi:hypothetical protein
VSAIVRRAIGAHTVTLAGRRSTVTGPCIRPRSTGSRKIGAIHRMTRGAGLHAVTSNALSSLRDLVRAARIPRCRV